MAPCSHSRSPLPTEREPRPSTALRAASMGVKGMRGASPPDQRPPREPKAPLSASERIERIPRSAGPGVRLLRSHGQPDAKCSLSSCRDMHLVTPPARLRARPRGGFMPPRPEPPPKAGQCGNSASGRAPEVPSKVSLNVPVRSTRSARVVHQRAHDRAGVCHE